MKFKSIWIVVLIFLVTSIEAHSAWQEVRLRLSHIRAKFTQSTSDAKIKVFFVSYPSPTDIEVNIKFQNRTDAQNIRDLLREKGISVSEEDESIQNPLRVFFPVDEQHRQQVRLIAQLFEVLNSFEPIAPAAIFNRMKNSLKATYLAAVQNWQNQQMVAEIQRLQNQPMVVWGMYAIIWPPGSGLFSDSSPVQTNPSPGQDSYLNTALRGLRGVDLGVPLNTEPTRWTVVEHFDGNSDELNTVIRQSFENHEQNIRRRGNAKLNQSQYELITEKKTLDEGELAASCGICLEEIGELVDQGKNSIVRLNCMGGHILCKACIEENYHYEQICPICRTPIEKGIDLIDLVAQVQFPLVVNNHLIQEKEKLGASGAQIFAAKKFCEKLGQRSKLIRYKAKPFNQSSSPLIFLNGNSIQVPTPPLLDGKFSYHQFTSIVCGN